jgi:hypothetical protein
MSRRGRRLVCGVELLLISRLVATNASGNKSVATAAPRISNPGGSPVPRALDGRSWLHSCSRDEFRYQTGSEMNPRPSPRA